MSSKVIVIGISGMDYLVTKGLLAAGKLPNFKQLMETGSFLRNDVSIPAESSVAWNSLLTGSYPSNNGQLDILSRDPLTYLPQLTTKLTGKKFFGEIAAERGVYTSTCCWPDTNLFTEWLKPWAEPDYAETNRQILVKVVTEREQQLKQQFHQELTKFHQNATGLLMIRLDGGQLLQQWFWSNPANNHEKIILHQVVVDYYQQQDHWLGEVINDLSSFGSEMHLLIVSNHGVTSCEKLVDINCWLHQQGFLQLISELNSNSNLLLNIADWNTTRAFALGVNSIYLNCEGREGSGIVQDKEPLLRELINKLESITDPQTKQRVIHKVYRTEELYSLKSDHHLPDLLIGFKPGFAMATSTIVCGLGQQFLSDNICVGKGTNNVDASFVPGVFFSNHKIDRQRMSYLDLAPTVLSLLNVKEVLEGSSLF